MANKTLARAKDAKDDEFYTQLSDIENELGHYGEHFRGRTVFCNCDDPARSDFWRYFHLNFQTLGLKKLISTYFSDTEPVYKTEYTGGNDADTEAGTKNLLEGNGDFESAECIGLLKEADIVVTNPPFSVAGKKFIPLLRRYNKKYLIVGDLNWVTYKSVFPMLKNGELRFGYCSIKQFRRPDGSTAKFGNKLWFTNLDTDRRHESLILTKNYYGSENKYPKYDNYDAINTEKVSDIPKDYYGVIGVPITFLNCYNPEQFEILGYAGGLGWNGINDVPVIRKYRDAKQHNPDGNITGGGKVNTGAALRFDKIPAARYYTVSGCDGYLLRTYGRILIRRKS